MLERKPAKRLGMLSGKAQDVKRHKWFEGFDWESLEARRVLAPRKPKVGADDASMQAGWSTSCLFLYLLVELGVNMRQYVIQEPPPCSTP